MSSPTNPLQAIGNFVERKMDEFRDNWFPRKDAVTVMIAGHEPTASENPVDYYKQNIAGLIEEVRILEQKAFTDPTSKSLNRNAFDEALGHIAKQKYADVLQAETKGIKADIKPTAIVFLDLNYLKQLNNISYANGGDKAIEYLSNYITNKLNASEDTKDHVFARFGGDEFGVIIQNCSKEQAETKIGKIVEDMAKDSLDATNGCICTDDHSKISLPVQVSAAFGCSELLTKLPDGEVSLSLEDDVKKIIHLSVAAAQKAEANNKIPSKKHAASITGGMPQADDREEAEKVVRAMLEKRFKRIEPYPEKEIITDSLRAQGGIVIPSTRIMLPEDEGFNDLHMGASQTQKPVIGNQYSRLM